MDRDELFSKDEDQVFDEILRYCDLNTSLSQEQQQKVWSTCRFAWLSEDYIQRASTVKDIPTKWLDLGMEERRQNRSPGASLVVSEGGKTSSGGDVATQKGQQSKDEKKSTSTKGSRKRKCHLCNVTLATPKDWQAHFRSDEHKKQMVSFTGQTSTDKSSKKSGKKDG